MTQQEIWKHLANGGIIQNETLYYKFLDGVLCYKSKLKFPYDWTGSITAFEDYLSKMNFDKDMNGISWNYWKHFVD